ncbi:MULTISPECIES: ATP-binding protein [unclassified Streptomyces]|uniref:ATP-binding protein n=1 Tax=unclassified Streptomyces TaxID=2593676 RepID=UPI003811B094
MITFELYRHQARHEQDSFAATATRIGCAKSGRLEYGHGLPDLGRAVGRRALKATLAAHPRTLVLDEAQCLSSDQLEYIRYLRDDPYTQLAVIFVGGEGCHATLRAGHRYRRSVHPGTNTTLLRQQRPTQSSAPCPVLDQARWPRPTGDCRSGLVWPRKCRRGCTRPRARCFRR